MSLNYTNKWQGVENTVNDRVLDGLLVHTLTPDKKIKKQTKSLNQKLKKTRNNLRSYKHFLLLKRQVDNTCQNDDETDDEPNLSHEAYKKIYNQKPKTQLKKFLRLCTRTKRREHPQKSEGKSPSHNSEKSNKSQAIKRSNCRTFSKANKSAVSVSNFNNVQSKLFEKQSQSSQGRLLNTRTIIRSSGEENVKQRNIREDDIIDEKNDIQKIVQDLISSNIEKSSPDALLPSDSEKVELTDFGDSVMVENISDQLTNCKQEYDVKDSLELDKELVVLDHPKQDSCNVISDVTEDPNASDSVPNSKEISNKDNLLNQEDIFMSDDSILSSEKNVSNQNNSKEDIDSLNCDSGNNSLSDADVLSVEHGKNFNDNAATCDYHNKEFVAEHCSTVNDENSIALHNVFKVEENVIELNRPASAVSLDDKLKKNVELSSRNLDSEGIEEIESTDQICNSESKAELSTESTASEKGSKLIIRAIEHYDKGYDIFCKNRLREEKRLKIVNNFENKSINNELISEDEQPLESRISSQDCHLPQTELQHLNELIVHDDSIENKISSQDKQIQLQHFNGLTDQEISIETKSTDNKLPSENEQPMTSKEPSKDCNLVQNESQHLNEVVDDENTSPLPKSSPEKFNISTNQTLLDGEEQTKGNTSFEENNTSEIKSYCLNRSLNSSFSSFSARSCDEDVKNSVKVQLLSEIEQRLKDIPTSKKRHSRTSSEISSGFFHNEAGDSFFLLNSNEDAAGKLIDNQPLTENQAQPLEDNGSDRDSNDPKILPQSLDRSPCIKESFLSAKSSITTKRRNSSSAVGHCSLENTLRSSKMPRLNKGSTKRQQELISREPKSQEAISHELQQKNNIDNSYDQNKQKLGENAHYAPKRKPRPKNLEDFVAMEELTQDTTKPHFRLKDIGDDDEIWIMDVPKMIDPKNLEDQIILLGGKSQLKFGDDYYKVSSKPAKEICNVSCIFATSRQKKQYKLENVESKGTIKFRQQLSVIPEMKPIPSKIAAVPFPKNLRIRHPLFGTTFEDKI